MPFEDSNKGLGANFAISYSQGLFGGLTVEVSKNKTRLMFFNRNVPHFSYNLFTFSAATGIRD